MQPEKIKIGMAVSCSRFPFTLFTIKGYANPNNLEIILIDNEKKETIVYLCEVFDNQREAVEQRLTKLNADNRSMQAQIACNLSEIKALEAIRYYV
jgi:hypothetical protein